MERRQHRRVPAQVKSLLRANSHEVEGETIDLSLGGAKIESRLIVQPGKQIALKLVVPEVQEPIYIEQAQVQWIHDQTFGVRFLEMQQREMDELEQLIEECIALDEAENA
ncbi:MAG: PilZ domain-containing protein [Nitrospirae bacterium]|nr:PilZ domain-containing protein [Nitrospirota bacterium]